MFVPFIDVLESMGSHLIQTRIVHRLSPEFDAMGRRSGCRRVPTCFHISHNQEHERK